MKYILAYDLGTGGTKASLFSAEGISCAETFFECITYYQENGYKEQNPEEWWMNIKAATKELVKKVNVLKEDIVALAISGHSLGVVPIGFDGSLLLDRVPIWSDNRGSEYAKSFFEKVDEKEWYTVTGNGFPAGLYSIFKIMYYQDKMPYVYEKTQKFIGTKDYINYRLTGILRTDHSYASGCGAYSLKERKYIEEYIEATKVDISKLPVIEESTTILGNILPEIAKEIGLSENTKVVCGGVDNACMALGAACMENGDSYTSLGTSAWIAVSSQDPIIDWKDKPYVFAHCIPGQFVSAVAIFSAGNSHKWVKNELCKNLKYESENCNISEYDLLNEMAKEAPAGSHQLYFNPSLAGGSSLDFSENIRGCFTGLELRHSQADIVRATMEGICFNLKIALDILEKYVKLSDSMLIVGGGSKSSIWNQIFADIYEKNVIITNVGQDAGSLGAAAIAAVGAGLWNNFDHLKTIHQRKAVYKPVEKEVIVYRKMLPVFKRISEFQSELGDAIKKIEEVCR